MFFDIEPYQAFADGMQDNILSGSLVTKFNNTLVTGIRTVVATNVSNSAGSYFTNAFKDYGEFANLYSGSFGLRKRTSIRLTELTENNNRYFDTILPDIHDCLNITGNGLAVVNTPSSSNYNRPYFVYLFSKRNINGTYNNITSINSSQRIADETWMSSFPFCSDFKQIKRRPNFDPSVIDLSYIISVSLNDVSNGPSAWMGEEGRRNIYGPGVSLAAQADSYPSFEEADFWNYGSSFGPADLTFTIGYVQTASVDSRMESNYSCVELLLTVTGSITDLGSNNFSFSPEIKSGWEEPDPANTIPQSAKTSDLIKHLFGNKPNSSNALTSSLDDLSGKFSSRVIYGSSIKGWKYGVLNGFPQFPKCLTSRKHHGFIRDIFEQRPYTKFYNIENRTITNPININFVTGTLAYLTMSLGLDERDSGIYNLEYAVGRPFSDN